MTAPATVTSRTRRCESVEHGVRRFSRGHVYPARKRIPWALVIIIAACVPVDGRAEEDKYAETLSGAVTIIHRSGREFKGTVRAVSDSEISILEQVDAGEVIFTFTREEVRRLIFPGESLWSTAADLEADGEEDEAISLMRALFDQRARFLFWLGEEDLVRFKLLADAYLHSGQSVEAIAVAGRLRPLIGNLAVRTQLDEAVLLGHYRLGLIDEARSLAESWIEQRSIVTDSAVGWWVLAQLQFEAQEFEQSLWTALRPIVFSGRFPVRYLGHCYATAIAAALEIDDHREADILRREMAGRELDWPDIASMTPYRVEDFPVDTVFQTDQ